MCVGHRPGGLEIVTTTPANDVRAHALTKTFGPRRRPVSALDGINHVFAPGSFTAVMGPSGCGKSTLLHCLAGLERPSTGTVELCGRRLETMNERSLTKLRRDHVGFIFQDYNLMPGLTVDENLILPGRLSGRRPSAAAIGSVLDEVGLSGLGNRRPAELSGGQQQRVAIARIMIATPRVLFADEPTGALDRPTAAVVLGLLRRAVDTLGMTLVMVTHDEDAAAWSDEVLRLDAGRIVNRGRRSEVGVLR